jgi:pyruvate dehydrogenase kinase 2/3/4
MLIRKRAKLGKISDSQMLNKHFRIGLQLARVFANYWGGELDVKTMYGYGSDVYVRINTTGDGVERLTVATEE